MKNVIKIFALSSLTLMLASCGAVNDTYGNNNPNSYPGSYPSNNGVYRTPDGTVYRQNDIYRDRNGNVYQNGRIVRTGEVTGQPGILGRNGNTNQVYYPNNNERRLPPGQAKKIYGGSAKDYAPGQLKKRSGNWNNNQNRQGDNGDRGYRQDDDRKYENRNGKQNKKNYKSKDHKKHGHDD